MINKLKYPLYLILLPTHSFESIHLSCQRVIQAVPRRVLEDQRRLEYNECLNPALRALHTQN